MRTLSRGFEAVLPGDKTAVPAVIMGTYVDDSIIAGSREGVDAVKADISAVFPIKDLGEAKTIIGIVIRRDRANKTIHLSQKKKVVELL